MASAITAFNYTKKVLIDTTAGHGATSTTLTDFTVCVHINSSSWTTQEERDHFFAAYNTNGKRIQFFDSSNNNLPYEVTLYNSGTPEAIYWVKVPSIAGNNNTQYITVAYGNDPNSADQDQGTSAWDSSYQGVWHLGDNQWGTTPEAKDSTTNGNHMTETSTASINVGNFVGNGRDFNGTTSAILSDHETSLAPTNALTISFYVRVDSRTGNYMGVLGFGHTWNAPPTVNVNPDNGDFRIYNDSGTSRMAIGYNATNSGQYDYMMAAANSFTHGVTYHIAGVKTDGVRPKLYRDGAALTLTDGSSGASHNLEGTDWYIRFGQLLYNDASTPFDGKIDEVRLSTTERSADWIKMEYNSTKTTNSYSGGSVITYEAEVSSVTWTPKIIIIM